MSEGWIKGRLGDFITLQRGYDLPSYKREEGAVPVVTSSGINGTHSIAKAKGPGVVMGRYGTIGEIFYIENDYWPHNTSLFVKDFKNNNPHFVYYFLKTLHYQAHNDKSSVPGLNRNDLHAIEVVIPPLAEQQSIAQILGSLDNKIELNRRMNETLEEIARTIFKSWFVDFDPVYAKSCGEQPPGMDAATAALFSDRFEDSELGPIPAGWRVGIIGDLAEYNNWTLGKKDLLDEIEYIEISEVMRGEINSTSLYVRGEEPSRARRRLRHGDTVLSTVRPDRGAYFLSLNPSPSLIASTGFAVFTPIDTNWSFLYSALIRAEVFERLGSLADGAAYPAIAPEVIAALPVVIPPTELQVAFHNIAALLYEQADQNRFQSRTLAKTRDVLLPKLVSGEVRVGEVDNLIHDVA